MLSVVKMLLKGEVGDSALISHGNYIVDHGISWKNHGIVFLNCVGTLRWKVTPKSAAVSTTKFDVKLHLFLQCTITEQPKGR